MHVSYDRDANVAYIRLARKAGRVRTIRVSEDVNVDVGADGSVYGIELLDAKSQLGSGRKITLRDKASGRRAELLVS
jgi:uncharacterized protein YuzE